ncbi:MAG: DJ-1/PfpI family protein [Chitinophagaceae bacterium]
MQADKDLIVGIPLYNNCTLMDFAGATQVFSAPLGFKAVWLAAEPTTITTENVSVVRNYDLQYHPPLDIIFVPGGDSTGVSTQMFNNDYLNFLRENSKTALWTGSVCTGAFILAAAGLLNGFEGDEDNGVTTYWSQIPNLSLLQNKCQFKTADGFPRYTFDSKLKRFSGGGISSSVDLALKLVEIIKGKETAQKTQLFIQYAPDPSLQSGDPSQAPPEIVKELTAFEADFTAAMNQSVQKLLNS